MLRNILIFYQYFYIRVSRCTSKVHCFILFTLAQIKHGTFNSYGTPIIEIRKGAICTFGDNLSMVNGARIGTLGKNNKCKILVYQKATLTIGQNVGMSNVTIVATTSISIGNNIMIGGGATIVDTDFHSLNPKDWHTPNDELNMSKIPVIIEDNVFIGMNSIILKGVTIGSNSIIAAGSVVSKNIPPNQIWGGNPAKFIKNNN